MNITLQELVDLIDGTLVRESTGLTLTGFGSLKDARNSDVSFCDNSKYVDDLAKTKAGVVIVSQKLLDAAPSSEGTVVIATENAGVSFDAVVRKFGAPEVEFCPGIHPSAVIGDGTQVDPAKVEICANAVLGPGVIVGDGTKIGACATIGQEAVIGQDCDIAANVSIREGSVIGSRVIIHGGVVIGGDGFGFEFVNGRHEKVEQLGIVRIEDDVEIGAATTIDRARFGETVIGEGTKIDNHVQIAHNVVIGKHCIIVSQTGIAGTCKIGDYVTMAAQVGIAPHIEIGDQAVLGGGAKVISNLEGGETYFGYPAVPMKDELRTKMHLKRLGGLFARVKKLEKNQQASDGEV
ncbi:MAG: UDP-3-O-(3-hydroxymyristoyl)glucosamine N-acyltransferase [Verrucomicrobia bacterium]|nr:UDP-3-O-(3-hydroxymyristoyl)glucosamine N-acyltransferase [Verrucomicrobiota bacterium]